MASGDLHQLFCEVIRNRQLIRFKYRGGERVVEPCLYGVTREGIEMLSAFQLAGIFCCVFDENPENQT